MTRNWIFAAVLACLNANAAIYNGTTDAAGSPNLTHAALLDHREIKMRELWPASPTNPDYSVINTSHVTTFVSALANDKTYSFDLEGDSTETNGLEDWHYQTSPTTATSLRLTMMQTINAAIPSHTIGMYETVDNFTVREAQKAPDNLTLANLASQNLVDYGPIADELDLIYVQCYWRWGATASTNIDEWQALCEKQIADARMYFGQDPIVYVWHRGTIINPPDEVSPEIFDAMLRFLACRMEVDMVFFSTRSDTEFEDWVQHALWRYSDGCPVD